MIAYPLEALRSAIGGRRVGLVCTPASRVGPQINLEQWLLANARVTAFLALEHGLRGELQDGISFESYADSRTGLPVFSFYGREKAIPAGFWEQVDVAVFCVQDVSHRAYTFKQSLAALLESAAAAGKPVLVVDRPTPLAHLGVRGPVHRQFFPVALPVVIPYTLGELGLLLVSRRRLDLDYRVLPVQGWRRTDRWSQTGQPWIPPSPNIPTLVSAYAYLATGLIQATSVSEGRGSCKPFEYVGAPWIDPRQLVERLVAYRLPGVEWRDLFFKPGFGKFAGEVCGGVHLLLVEPHVFEPLRTALALLQALARLELAPFQIQIGLAEWLDGVVRRPADFADLDLEATLADWAAAGRQFATEMGEVAIREYDPE